MWGCAGGAGSLGNLDVKGFDGQQVLGSRALERASSWVRVYLLTHREAGKGPVTFSASLLFLFIYSSSTHFR